MKTKLTTAIAACIGRLSRLFDNAIHDPFFLISDPCGAWAMASFEWWLQTHAEPLHMSGEGRIE
jgi:hypothetical protein